MLVILLSVCGVGPCTFVSASILLPRPLGVRQRTVPVASCSLPCCHLFTFTILDEKGGWHLHHSSNVFLHPPSSEDQTPLSLQPNYSHMHTPGAETEPLPWMRYSPGVAPHERGGAPHHSTQRSWSTSCLPWTSYTRWVFLPLLWTRDMAIICTG